ncbi:hypothetical protein KC644_03015 [Candidatus Berkelbacteria bacterium]|nr:hypothetical protein [Candidatus Berkelbacteria bacterium]
MKRLIILVRDFAQPIEVSSAGIKSGPIRTQPGFGDTVILQVSKESLLAQTDLIASLEDRDVNIVFITSDRDENLSRQIMGARIKNSILIRTPKSKDQIKKIILEFLAQWSA